MKKFILSLMLTFGLFLGLQAQTPNNNQSKPNGTQAEIKFDKEVHDYGTVKRNGNGETTFTYTNTGKAPLVLSNVRSSCGCTVPSWSREPIMPGQSGTLTVKYNTASVGPINKTVTVESNATKNRVVLRITGKVVQSEN